MTYLHVPRSLATDPNRWVETDTYAEAIFLIEDEYRTKADPSEVWEYLTIDAQWFNSGPWEVAVFTDPITGRVTHDTNQSPYGETKGILTPIRAVLRHRQSTTIALSYLPHGAYGSEPVARWELDAVDDSTPIFNGMVHSINDNHHYGW